MSKLLALLLWMVAPGILAQTLPEFDFRIAETAREWGGTHHISGLRATADGLEIAIDGNDPYFHGPARDYPANTPLWLIARLKTEQAGGAELFYFREQARAGESVQFHVPAGRWFEARVALPSLGPGYRLRFDPPGQRGKVTLASLRFEKRVKFPEPAWPAWSEPAPGTEQVVSSGALELFANESTPLGLELRVDGRRMGFMHPRPRIACVLGEEVRWLELGQARIERSRNGCVIRASAKDADGALWEVRQSFRPGGSNSIAAETSVTVDRERTVLFLPMHLFFAGEGSFGARKNQGLFAGLEYLEDEPSSSEADIVGPESNRRAPAPHKITMPLMAIQADGRYAGLAWEETRRFSALFDSPDRTFASHGHALGLFFPGAEAPREEGSLLPYAGVTLRAGEALVSRAWIIGGLGKSVIPAVQQFVQLHGLPELPKTGLEFADYLKLASQGWLDSKLRDGAFYRHAFWPGFNPQPAADAAVFETWLAGRDSVRSEELLRAATQALGKVPRENYYHSAVSHVRTPAAPLVFGGAAEAVEAARQSARGLLARFEPDGSIPYRASGKGPDYGKTHFSKEANGLASQVVASLLEAAAFSGDRELITQALQKLRGLEKFRDTVPRGAQTWEVPLHTPDILASAHLVRAFTLGYELSGNREFLEQAKYWAWTGVPFVYLANPTGQPVGPYSTIAVLGATNWKAPVWFGRPVQWCGLVYGDALYRLVRHDPSGPWKQLADGIAAAGLQHTWRADYPERVGLLPDFFELREQLSAGPAINPGTLGASAIRLFGQGPLCDFVALRQIGVLLHAPGEISVEMESEKDAIVTVRGWPKGRYFVLVGGAANPIKIKRNGEPVEAQGGTLVECTGSAGLEIRAE